MALYTVLLAYVMLGLYIFFVTQNKGFNSGIVEYFLSLEQSGIKFRALVLLAPFVLTVISYLINERAQPFKKTILAEQQLRQRTFELDKVNELLKNENAARKKAEEKLISQAFYDSLTNLSNRALFMDRLHKILERKKRYPDYIFAVFFLDVDRFKTINDGFGHSIGDQLLILLSQRLKESIRSVDTVARFGGDEFAILVDDAKEPSHINDLADRIQDEMRLPFYVFGHEIFATVSIGIVLSNADDYSSLDELIRDADNAMYRAKERGRACHAHFVQ